MNRKRIFLLVFACMAMALRAQISPLADQFLINPFLTNPAFNGNATKEPLSLTARQQLAGMQGGPSWQSVTWHTSFDSKRNSFNPWGLVNKGKNFFGNVGFGGGAFSVKYGAISQMGIHLNYAYHVTIGTGWLTFGLAPMYMQYIIDKSGFIRPNGTIYDPLIDGDAKEVLHFIDVNAGIHYGSKKIFAGFSVIQLFNSSVSFGEFSFQSNDKFSENPYLARSLYLYGGVTPSLGENLILEPSVVLKYNGQSGFSFQVNFRATMYQRFQAGLLYHYQESAGFFAGVRIGDLIFRYQFEAPIGTALLTAYLTHQVMVGYLF